MISGSALRADLLAQVSRKKKNRIVILTLWAGLQKPAHFASKIKKHANHSQILHKQNPLPF